MLLLLTILKLLNKESVLGWIDIVFCFVSATIVIFVKAGHNC